MDRLALFLRSLIFLALFCFATQSHAEYYLVYPGPYVVCNTCCNDCHARHQYHKTTHHKKHYKKHYHHAKCSNCYVEEYVSCATYDACTNEYVRPCASCHRWYYSCPAHRTPNIDDSNMESYEWVE